MSSILWEVLQDSLFVVPSDWERTQYLPSPMELERKVLLKGGGKLSQLDQRFKIPRIAKRVN